MRIVLNNFQPNTCIHIYGSTSKYATVSSRLLCSKIFYPAAADENDDDFFAHLREFSKETCWRNLNQKRGTKHDDMKAERGPWVVVLIRSHHLITSFLLKQDAVLKLAGWAEWREDTGIFAVCSYCTADSTLMYIFVFTLATVKSFLS